MNVNIFTKLSSAGDKFWHYLQWGKSTVQRRATGIFTYAHPKTLVEKNHNKEALAILETKKAQMVLDGQAVGTGYIPKHKIKTNFLEYYENYIKKNRLPGNRHLETSLAAFKGFIKNDFISAIDFTEKDHSLFWL